MVPDNKQTQPRAKRLIEDFQIIFRPKKMIRLIESEAGEDGRC